MKKSIVFILIFIAAFFFSIDSVVAKDTSFTISEDMGKEGDVVTVKIEMNDNPKFGLLGIKIYYDKEQLEYKSGKIIGLKKAFMKDVGDVPGETTFYALVYDNTKLLEDTGEICQISYKILSKTNEDILLKMEVTDYGIDENVSLGYTTSDGLIRVRNDLEEVVIRDQENGDNQINLSSEVENGENIVWSSSNPNIAEVDENGNVIFKGEGNVTIQAVDQNNNVIYEKNYRLKSDKIEFSKTVIIAGIIAILLILGIILLIRKHYGKNKEQKA